MGTRRGGGAQSRPRRRDLGLSQRLRCQSRRARGCPRPGARGRGNCFILLPEGRWSWVGARPSAPKHPTAKRLQAGGKSVCVGEWCAQGKGWETGNGNLRACLGFRASPFLHLCPLLSSFRALWAHETSPAPAPGMAPSRSRAPAPSPPVPKAECFREKSPRMVSPPGLPNPERLQGKQSSPCAPLGLLTRIRSSFFSLPEAAQRLRAFAGSLCTKTGRGDGAGFFVANVGQGKGGS